MSDKDERTPDFESGGVREINLAEVPTELAILPLRDTILFPHAILPLAVARESSVALVHDAVRERKVIGVVTQRDPAVDDPVESDLYRIGTLTHIHKMFKFPDGSLRLVVQGVQRFRLHQVHQYRPFLKAPHRAAAGGRARRSRRSRCEALAQSAQGLFQRVVELSPTLSDELQTLAANIQDPSRLADFIAASLPSADHAPEAGDAGDARRARAPRPPQQDPGQGPRGAGGRQQDPEPGEDRAAEEPARVLPARADEGHPEGAGRGRRPAARVQRAAREDRGRRACPRRSRRRPCASWTASPRCRPPPPSTRWPAPTSTGWWRCPGTSARRPRSTSSKAKEVLDNDHYDLEKVKERILEYLAVRKMKPDIKGPILCFVGPSRRGQDLAGPVDRLGHGAQVPPHQPGRHARRGRDPRPSPHLHRRPARPDHPGPAPRGEQEPGVHARRGRQAGRRLPRRPGVGPARGAGPRAEQHLQGPLHRPAVRPVARCCSSPPPTCSTPSRPRCATAWRSSAWPATSRRRSSTSRAGTSSRASSRTTG